MCRHLLGGKFVGQAQVVRDTQSIDIGIPKIGLAARAVGAQTRGDRRGVKNEMLWIASQAGRLTSYGSAILREGTLSLL